MARPASSLRNSEVRTSLTGDFASQDEKGPASAATDPDHGSPSAKKAEHMDNITAPADPATRPSAAAMRFYESIEHFTPSQLKLMEEILVKLRFKEDPSTEVIALIGEEKARPIITKLGFTR